MVGKWADAWGVVAAIQNIDTKPCASVSPAEKICHDFMCPLVKSQDLKGAIGYYVADLIASGTPMNDKGMCELQAKEGLLPESIASLVQLGHTLDQVKEIAASLASSQQHPGLLQLSTLMSRTHAAEAAHHQVLNRRPSDAADKGAIADAWEEAFEQQLRKCSGADGL